MDYIIRRIHYQSNSALKHSIAFIDLIGTEIGIIWNKKYFAITFILSPWSESEQMHSKFWYLTDCNELGVLFLVNIDHLQTAILEHLHFNMKYFKYSLILSSLPRFNLI